MLRQKYVAGENMSQDVGVLCIYLCHSSKGREQESGRMVVFYASICAIPVRVGSRNQTRW